MKRGFTLIELMIVIAIIAIIAAIAIPNLLAARKQGNEASAISSMRTLNTAQVLYRESFREADGSGRAIFASDIAELSAAGTDLIDDTLGSGQRQGYAYQIAEGATAPQFSWDAGAAPINENTGDRWFYIDSSGVVRFSQTGTPGTVVLSGDGGESGAPAGYDPVGN